MQCVTTVGKLYRQLNTCFLFFCKNDKIIFRLVPIQWDRLHELRSNFASWKEGILQAKSRELGHDHIIVTVLMWQIWEERNRKFLENSDMDVGIIVQKVRQNGKNSQEIRISYDDKHTEETTPSSMGKQWKPLDIATIKINRELSLLSQIKLVWQHQQGTIMVSC